MNKQELITTSKVLEDVLARDIDIDDAIEVSNALGYIECAIEVNISLTESRSIEIKELMNRFVLNVKEAIATLELALNVVDNKDDRDEVLRALGYLECLYYNEIDVLSISEFKEGELRGIHESYKAYLKTL